MSNEKYYIHLEQLNKNEYIYGVLSIKENSPFDYKIGRKKGTRDFIIDDITKDIILDIHENFGRDTFDFKYTNLHDAKLILKNIQTDPFYSNYRVNSTPAVFLSDMDKVNLITSSVQKAVLQEKMLITQTVKSTIQK